MSWAIGYDDKWQRDIGYGVPAVCDHPDCNQKIDRGLAHVCGGAHGCGLFFCDVHLSGFTTAAVCARCETGRAPFQPKADIEEWVHHKATHPSWG